MKKTLNINIGNSIIHIEEDAFELLTNYLIEVKQHFGKSADDFEIVADIENRIAEMFTEVLHSQQKQVIELEDVQVVIGLMGSVKDFEEQEDEPETKTANSSAFAERKIYRDRDEAMVAGVCSGLSHYLNIDVSILRVLTVLTIFLGGSGIIAYLILWIAVPAAQSRSEKMAMKGEAVNLQGFKRHFEEELSTLQPLVKHSRNFIAEFVEVLGTFLQGTGKVIFKFIAVVIIIAGSCFFLGALAAGAALLGIWDTSTSQLFPFNIIDADYYAICVFAAFVVVAIPLLALILFSVQVAFNSRPLNKMISYGLLLIWLGGLAVAIFYTARISGEFKEDAEFTQAVPLKAYPVYTLKVDRSKFFSKEDSLRYQLNSADYNGRVIINDHDGPFGSEKNVRIRIERSENGVPSLTESYRSEGKNFEIALNHAKNIQYDFVQRDSVLMFSPELHLKKAANWRDQRVELTLRIPVGMKLNIERDMDRYLRDYSLWDCGDDDKDDIMYRGVMTDDGLACQHKM